MIHSLIAVVLSFFVPGAGQVYAGRRWTAAPYMIFYFGLAMINLFKADMLEDWQLMLRFVSMIDAGIYTWYKERRDPVLFQGRPWMIRGGISILLGVLLFFSPQWYFNSLIREALKEEFTPKKDTEVLKRDAVRYLEKKYGKKFVAYHVEYLPFTEAYFINVYPVDDKSLKFSVLDDNMRAGFSDTYREVIWDRQFIKDFAPVLAKQFPDAWRKEIDLAADPKRTEKIPTKNIPYYQHILKQDNDFFLLHLKLNLYASQSPEKEFKRVLQLISIIKSLNIKRVSISIEYYNESVKSLKKKDSNIVYHLEYVFDIAVEDVNSIRTEEDLKKYLVTY